MKYKISVIVPSYNCSKYIGRLLDSVLSQSYQNFELIILDDGSNDNTREILNACNNSHIKVICKPNTGVSDTRNMGLSLATGDLICFLDSDDYIDSNYFQRIVDIFKENPDIELLNFGFYSETENKKEILSDKISYKTTFYKSKEEIKRDFVNLWDSTMLYNIWNKVYLKRIIDDNKIKFPDTNWGEDVIFNQMYLNVITNLYNSDEAFYHYIRERVGALTNSYKENLFEIRKQEFEDFNCYFSSWQLDKNDYYEFSCRRYIERILGCIENLYGSMLSLKQRYEKIREMIKDPMTKEALKHIMPKSKKIKLMIIPLKMNCVLLTMFMGRIFHFTKVHFPGLFNKLKNRR